MVSGFTRAVWAAWAHTARRDFGIVCGERAAFERYWARQHRAAPTRTNLEPLAAAEAVLWAACLEWDPPERDDG